MKNSFVTILLAGVIAVSAAGCGNRNADTAPSVESKAAEVTEAASSSEGSSAGSQSESVVSSSS